MKENEKVALITGIGCQDGSYLTELLLKKITPFMEWSDGQAICCAHASSICGAMRKFTVNDCFCIMAIYRTEQRCAA